jgi:mannose-6-phosphate isomerase-like protein (cupin superfamily)
MLARADFEKVAALQSHRKVLQKDIARTRRLIETIDKTIQHLKGLKKMKSEQMFFGFSVAAGQDRFGEHIRLGNEPNDCKVSAKDTDGAMCAFEGTGHSGGPRHLHYEQDEWIYILDGEFEFLIGAPKEHAKPFRLGPGESVFIPRKVPHVWGCVNGPPGRIINMYQPAGKMEEFFREVGNFKDLPTAEQMLNKSYTEEQVMSLHKFFHAYGMDLLGPPLGHDLPLDLVERGQRPH